MNRRLTLLVASAVALRIGSAKGEEHLTVEMQRLGVKSALVLASQAVDERPVWSPDGNALAVNVDGHWLKVDLEAVRLEEGTWRDKERIGVLSKPATTPVAESVVKDWEKAGHYGDRKVVTPGGTAIELKQTELSTELVVTKAGARPDVVWRSGFENCYALSVSPNGRTVAYICELNGVIVTLP